MEAFTKIVSDNVCLKSFVFLQLLRKEGYMN